MELNLGSRAVFQLVQKFNFLNSQLDCEGYLPVVNIPIELAQTLYHLYIESVNQQEENQNKILAMVNREDEMYARRLVQEDIEAEFNFLKTSNFNLIVKDKKAKPNKVKVSNGNAMNNVKEELIELILDSQVLFQLEAQFGEFNMIPKGFQPVVHVSLTLAEELYSAYTRYNLNQKKDEEELQKTIAKEERKAAKKLKRNESKSSNQVVSKPNILDGDFVTVKKKKKSKQPIEAKTEVQINSLLVKKRESQSGNNKKTAENYRQEANMYLEKQQENDSKAKQAYQKKNAQVALHYSEMAKTNRLLYDEANEMAVKLLMESENVKQSDTMDLHYFSVKEAMQYLDMFIDVKVNLLNKSKKKVQMLFIIVGRGIHSGNKGSKLGPAAEGLLRKRDIKFNYNATNSGMLEIKIYPNTKLCS